MKKSYWRLRSTRRLSIESLESRRLLAADQLDHEELSAAVSVQSLSIGTAEVSIARNGGVVSPSDAGSTRDTAANVGAIDGTRRFNGSLGWIDWVDAIQFTVQRDADVRVELSRLNRNANLYLVDDAGNLIDHSVLGRRSIDTVTASLEAGDYFIFVTATSFRSTWYQLSITARLQPASPPAPAPPTPAPPEPTLPDPVSSPTTPTQPDRNANDKNSVRPLRDVAYFGRSRDWNINAIGAPEAWAAGYTGRGITVAVIDTGVDLDHPDLAKNLYVNPGEIAGNGIDDDGNGYVDDVNGYDFVDRDADPNDANGHGTHVAGTIAAVRNGFGATGIAPDAKILPVRVLDKNGSGNSNDVAEGIRYAARLGADIINLSLGGGYSRAIDAAIDYARSLGSLIVAAAGNESALAPGYPARFSATDNNVISVGAYSSSGALAGYSNDVGGSDSVQVDAPGSGIFSTYVGGRYATLSGTSMAAPHVAGLAALILSSNPSLTSPELRDLLATGTVGRAAGSDAIGSANATTSVAYAAAGLSTAPRTSATIRRGVTTASQAVAIRSVEATGTPFTQVDWSTSIEVGVADLWRDATPEDFSGQKVYAPFNSLTAATTHRIREIDSLFDRYGLDEIEVSDEIDPLVLLSIARQG